MAHGEGIVETDELRTNSARIVESSTLGENPRELPLSKSLPLLGIATATIAAAYSPTFTELVQIWNVDPNYSHGFVVPFASLLFAIMAWNKVGIPVRGQVTRANVVIGLAEVALGFLLHIIGWLTANLFIDVVGLICLLRGVMLALGGRDVNKAYGFSVLFLIFMAPLPAAWYQPIAIVMQQLVSAISTEILQAFGVPTYREGYIIHLVGLNDDRFQMEVGEACSGLRQLTAVLALSVAIGHLARKRPMFTWTLALLSIPIAISANCIRVVLTGVIMMLFGRKWAEGVFHTLEGLAIVALAAVLVVGAAWCLVKIEGWLTSRRSSPKPDNTEEKKSEQATPPSETA